MAEDKQLTAVKSLARGYTEVAIKTLGGIAKDGTSEPAKVAAAVALLDRGWGKPQQDNSHEVKGKIEITLRKLLSGEPEKEE